MDHESAARSVEEMNEKEVPGRADLHFTVCRAQKKSERQSELKRRYEQFKADRIQRFQGVNLYVKNLDDTVLDDALRKHFEQHGAIASAKVICDESGRSKGFGFFALRNLTMRLKRLLKSIIKLLGTNYFMLLWLSARRIVWLNLLINTCNAWLLCVCKTLLELWKQCMHLLVEDSSSSSSSK
uniref:RRM domain-containing protein n=1 Tax=Meloidogyne enterolobii TaxID=390850 RepID=A0A6V7TW36_MELEN|nr:unnamed protein product [Meloidogyne enterolobii]